MKLSLTIATLATLLLSAVAEARREKTTLRHHGLKKSGNHGLSMSGTNGADNYFALFNSADQRAPACMSSPLGSGNVVATVRDDIFCIKLSYDGMSGPALFAHVHGPAAVGETGPIIFTIDTTNTEKTQCFELTKDQKKDVDDELWYFNIQSDICPNDAIRSQILPLVSNVGTIVKQLRQKQPGETVTEMQ
jgi:hypothetical protein